MFIDFHAHIYPEKIASKTASSISQFYQNFKIEGDGTAEGLLKSGEKIGISHFVVHSAATKPSQVSVINNFIMNECQKHSQFVAFGTMHPNFENPFEELKRIKDAGFKGIKLHPDLQQFKIDEPIMNCIYDALSDLDLIVLFHTGDERFDFSHPKRVKNLRKNFPKLKIVAAHFGGYSQWQESFDILRGVDVFFDTSSSLWKMPQSLAKDFINTFGSEKFLFGSDFPMWTHENEFKRFKLLNLKSSEEENILWKNAKYLLGL